MSKLEQITLTILSENTKKNRDLVWKYLRSESARAEAELISIANETQKNIVSILTSINANSLKNYKTKTAIEDVKSTLSRMIGNSELAANRMIKANILAGKVKSNTINKQEIINQNDEDRIQRMVNDVVGNIQRGASLTFESVKSMINRASIKSNMQLATGETRSTDIVTNQKAQEPISSSSIYNQLERTRTNKKYSDIPLTKEESEELKKNASKFIESISKKNISEVDRLHKEYISQQVKQNKSNNNDNMTAAQKISNEMNNSLEKNGVFAFSDIGGKRWSLVNYCSMSIRTASSRSTNLGEVFGDEVHDLYYIVPHSGSCPICKKYEGKVYSRSGKDKRFPALATAFSKINPNGSDDLDNTYFVIHPNCRHKIIKFYEKKNASQIKALMKKSNEQIDLTDKQKTVIKDNKEKIRQWNNRAYEIRNQMKQNH